MLDKFFWILITLTIVIFFRIEIKNLLSPYRKYNPLFVSIFLVGLSILSIVTDHKIDTLILLVQHNIVLLKHTMNVFFDHLFFHHYIEELSDYLFRGVILAYLIFYPYRYQQRFPSIVYKAQNDSVAFFYQFFMILFCLFCGRFGI